MKNAYSLTLCCTSMLLLVSTIPAEAQSARPEISANVGAMQFDASGTGTVPVIAVRAGVPLVGSWLVGEANLSFASLDEQFSELGTRVGVAEGQLQVQLPLARFRPYLGAGAGWLHYFNNAAGRPATSPTFSGAAGMRVRLSGRFGARAELRLRGWDHHSEPAGSSFGASAAEWTAGWVYSF